MATDPNYTPDYLQKYVNKYGISQGFGVDNPGIETGSWKTSTGEINYAGVGAFGHWHSGIDIQTPRGTPLYANFAGKVQDVWDSSGFGQKLTVDSGQFTELFGHTSATRFAVTSGQQVQEGQLIGYTDSTGNSTGPHVHVGLINDVTRYFQDPSGLIGGLMPVDLTNGVTATAPTDTTVTLAPTQTGLGSTNAVASGGHDTTSSIPLSNGLTTSSGFDLTKLLPIAVIVLFIGLLFSVFSSSGKG